jgi:hypothetical protein
MRQVSVTTGPPQMAKAAQRDRTPVFIIKLCCGSQGLEKVVPCLPPLSLLLRHPAQLVIGAGLAVAVLALDTDGQGLLVVLLRLPPLPLLLRHQATLVIGVGLAVAVIALDTDGQGLLVVLLRLSPLPLLLRHYAQVAQNPCFCFFSGLTVQRCLYVQQTERFLVRRLSGGVLLQLKLSFGDIVQNTKQHSPKRTA